MKLIAAAFALVVLQLVAGVALSACTSSSSSGAQATISLSSDAREAPADGLATIHLSATLAGAPADAVVTFEVQGVGLLSATNALAANGTAGVELYAPTEDELVAGASTSKVIAHYTNGTFKADSAPVVVSFTVPTQGAPEIVAHASPDRVLAGGSSPITLVVDARRLSSPSVALAVDAGAAIAVPATLALTDPSNSGLLHGELPIDAPATPADVVVHVTAAGAAPVDVTLHFIAQGAAAFDVTGTFAEVSYGVMEIGGLGPLLDPPSQCVVSPTFTLVNVVQTDKHIVATSTMCQMNMGGVHVGFGQGDSTNSVGPGFVDAINRKTAPLAFDLQDASTLPALWKPPFAAYSAPVILGANLANPHDDLPTNEQDPRVVDDDNDGAPGVTISNSSQGAQHVVTRTTTTEMKGTVASSDEISGTTSGQTDTSILNASTPLSPQITGFPGQWFSVRVDGKNGGVNIAGRDGDASSISCADVIAYESELVAAHPAPSAASACQ